MKPILVVLMLASIALAGCGDKESEPTGSVTNPGDLDAGRGAIAGLLVDDRYRPIAAASVLLEQTGARTTTTENGEFSFVNLLPDTYTLRVNAPGHEATPIQVVVREGEFTEQTTIARRTISDGGAILTAEYAVFIPCAVDYIGNGGNLPCSLDLGDDEYSSDFMSDLAAINNITYVVTEFKASQENDYEVQIRDDAPDDWLYFGAARFSGDYVKIVNQVGVANDEHAVEAYGDNVPFDVSNEFRTIFFVDHADAKGLVPGTCCGLGASMGIKGTFVQSVFIGEPEIDVATYQTYS